jgi:catechol 2,3-dioxygenase-like lactoylglutathione lyase family enzyme
VTTSQARLPGCRCSVIGESGLLFRWNAVCIDCHPHDMEQVVALYVGLTGLEAVEREDRWVALRGTAADMSVNVQAEDWYTRPVWPERRDVPTKMMHFEVQVDDVAAAVESVVALGGQQAEPHPPDRDPRTLRVMLDPAGHPFCLWS